MLKKSMLLKENDIIEILSSIEHMYGHQRFSHSEKF